MPQANQNMSEFHFRAEKLDNSLQAHKFLCQTLTAGQSDLGLVADFFHNGRFEEP